MKEVKINYKALPNCLRKYRKVNGLSQKQVALMLRVRNTGMISRWENGSRFPSPLNLFRLSVLYRTMADALYPDVIRTLRQEMHARREGIERKKLPR